MTSQQQMEKEPLSVSLEHIGGIDTLDLDIPPGVTVLGGDNATNRTSTLHGIMAALGSEYPGITVKTGHDQGQATISIDGESFSTTITQSESGPILTGDSYLDDPTPADQYAFLLRDNPVRQAVETTDDLYPILMDPVDTDAIEAKIDDLRRQRKTLSEEINAAQAAADELPALEEDRTKTANRLEELKERQAEIKAKQQEIREQASPQRQAELDEISQERENKQSELDQVRRKIDRAETQLEQVQEKYESLDIPNIDITELEAQRDQLETEIETLKDTERDLKQAKSKIIGAQNTAQDLLHADQSLSSTLTNLPKKIDIPTGPLSLTHESKSAEDLTSELPAGGEIYCTACGSKTHADDIKAVIDQYKELKQMLAEEINAVQSERGGIKQEIADINTKINKRDDKVEEKSELEYTIDKTENKLEELSEEKDKLETDVNELQAQEHQLEQEIADVDDVEEIQTDLTKIEAKITRAKRDLEKINEDIDAKETEAKKEEELIERKEAAVDEYEAKVSEIDRIEQELINQFNDNMDEILSILSYKNIARAWIERKSDDDNEDTDFQLHIVRETEQGAREGHIERLSESERAVIGLTVALTGYLVHDVAVDCPVMLLDSIEMIDATRIEKLLRFFGTHTDYLVAALLSEDANQMPTDEFTIISA